MSIQSLREQIGDYAKDTRINLGAVLEEEGAPGLTKPQIMAIALASAYATANQPLINAVELEAAAVLSPQMVTAAQTAVTLMAMNNVYYRFVHLVGDKEYGAMKANIRMNGMRDHGIDPLDFELMSLAVSALNGCGMCMDSHEKTMVKSGVTKQAIQSAVRIAAVINAAAQSLVIAQSIRADNTMAAA